MPRGTGALPPGNCLWSLKQPNRNLSPSRSPNLTASSGLRPARGFAPSNSKIPCSLFGPRRRREPKPPAGRSNDVPRPDASHKTPRTGRRHPQGRNEVEEGEALDPAAHGVRLHAFFGMGCDFENTLNVLLNETFSIIRRENPWPLNGAPWPTPSFIIRFF